MTLTDLYTLIGDLCNDAAHDRYSTSQIDTVLMNAMDEWNIEAGIVKDAVTLTTVDGTREYALSGLTGTPIRFDRVTHSGIELERKDKAWFDLYADHDWTTDTGTPKKYYIDVSDPDEQSIFVYPTPQSADAGANLVVEYVKRQDALSGSTDVPFNSNTLLYPYHHGLAYRSAAFLLLRDPSQENVIKSGAYLKTSNQILTKVVEVFKSAEKEAPWRLRGGRYWK